MVCEGRAKRCYQHVIDLLALFFLFNDVRDAILQLHNILLVKSLLFVKLAHRLPKLVLELKDLLCLILLLLNEHRIISHLVVYLRDLLLARVVRDERDVRRFV